MNAANLRKIKSGFVKTNDVHQAGLACLASVIKFFGGNPEMQRLYINSGSAKNGVNLSGLCKAAQKEGFEANGFKANMDVVKGLDTPVILHISKGLGIEDFIILYGWHKNKFIVGDPQWGIVEYREDELEAIWKSNILMFLKTNETFQTESEKARVKRKWLFKLLENQKGVLLMLSIFGLILGLILIASLPFIIEKVATIIQILNVKELMFDVAFLLVSFLVIIAVLHLKNVFVVLGTKSSDKELNSRIINDSFKLVNGSEEFSQMNLDYLLKAVSKFNNFVFNVSWGIPFYSMLFIASLVYISFISVWMGIIVFIATALYFVIVLLNLGKIEKLNASEYKYLEEKGDVLNRNWNLRKPIRLSNSGKKITSETIEAIELHQDTRSELNGIKSRLANWFFLWVIVTMFVVVAYNLFIGEDKIQTFWQSILAWAIVRFFSIYSIKNFVISFFHTKVSFDFFYNRIANESLFERNQVLEGGINEVLSIRKLELENLGFALSGQMPVFENIKLTAEIGEITAVNGASGSGKSVLVSVLSRLLPLKNGQILVNDLNWSEISDSVWRKSTSTVLQPVQLLSGTVLENIAWGSKYFEPKKIDLFCKKMGFDKFLKELPNGYATKSTNLSGGQKQLIALAAGLYKNPKLLLLDEPFVFMDQEMSHFCMELLHKLKNEMVVIIFTTGKKLISKEDKFFVYKMINYNYV